jgi:hypothetical protein
MRFSTSREIISWHATGRVGSLNSVGRCSYCLLPLPSAPTMMSHSTQQPRSVTLMQDTGQLCRTGEGAETTRLGRHYLEDCHTGEFFQLAQQPTSGLWAWIRCVFGGGRGRTAARANRVAAPWFLHALHQQQAQLQERQGAQTGFHKVSWQLR